MGVRPEYFMAATAGSPFYGPARRLDQMVKPGERLQTESLPAGWLRQVWDVWEGWTPRDWRPRLQGWKIHVSASQACAAETLARTTRVCLTHGVAFKFLPTQGQVLFSNGKQNDRGQSGKFITIYPDDDAHLEVLLGELETVLQGLDGPYILNDLRYHDAPVYVRYGGIAPLSYPDGVDEPVSAIASGADHRLVADRRSPRFEVPEGVELPACLEASYERSRRSEPSRLRDFKAISPLHFSNAGGVYKATLPDGTRRVLREARPFTGLDGRGRDAIERQRDEETVLCDLADVPGVQRIVGAFRAWEHRYLELEYVDGVTLTSWIVRHAPSETRDGGVRKSAYGRRCLAVVRRLIEVVERIHARGWCIGDLHPGNLIVTPDDDVVVLDLEDATRRDADRVIGFRAFEFCAPQGYSAEEADWFAVSRSIMMMFVPDWELEVIAPEFWSEALRRVGEAHGSPAVDLLRSVTARFPATPHLLSPDAPVGLWPVRPDAEAALAALDDGVEWSRRFSPTGSFPGDPLLGADAPESWGFGRAGVVWARARVGRPVPDADVAALEHAASGWGPHERPGLVDGLAGIALALADAGRPAAAVAAAHRALDSAAGRRRLDLHGGITGTVLAALEVAAVAGDGDLRERAASELARLDAALVEGTSSWAALTHRRGLHHGLSGVALAHLAAHLATGEPRHLDRAIDLVRLDVAACITTEEGDLMVADVDNGRALPYVDWGSAGVWAVALAAERLARQHVLTPDAVEGFAKACAADIYVYPGLHRGRAGTLGALAASGQARDDEVARQQGLLRDTLLHHEGKALVAGEGFLRLSSDLATGAAGVMVALHAVKRGRPFDWLPLARVSAGRLAALPVPEAPTFEIGAGLTEEVATHG